MLGAKYAPCMRRDKHLFSVLKKERLKENKTGCCLETFNTGCIQRQQTECSVSFVCVILPTKTSNMDLFIDMDLASNLLVAVTRFPFYLGLPRHSTTFYYNKQKGYTSATYLYKTGSVKLLTGCSLFDIMTF